MAKEKISLLIEAGKAVISPELGQKLGPLGINIQDILNEINKKTSEFAGMKVPVKIEIDKKTKEYNITIGTPPTSQLIKKEISIEKGSAKPHVEKIGNLAMEQVVKIAKLKESSMLVNNIKSGVKTIIGSCNSLGVLVEGMEPYEINSAIDSGKYDDIINTGTIEVKNEKLEMLKEQLVKIQEKYKALEQKALEEEEKPKEEKPIEQETKEKTEKTEKIDKKEVKEDLDKKEVKEKSKAKK